MVTQEGVPNLYFSDIFRMTIAVNTRLLLNGRLDGMGTFMHETLRRMTSQHPEHRFVFFFDRPHNPAFVYHSNVTPVQLFPPTRHPLLWWWWFEQVVPQALQKAGADIFLSPDGHLSLRTSVPSLPVIHDINFEHYPQDLPFAYRTYYRRYFPRFARKASRIATVSAFSRDDIAKTYGIDPSRIDVVGNAAGTGYQPLDATASAAVRTAVTGGAPYFLSVSTLHKRKNVTNTIQAFNRFKSGTGSPLHMVFAGSKKWWTPDMEEAVNSSPYRNHLHFPGRVPQRQLEEMTAAAFAAVYTSTFEGFGIPLLEAMQCGVPVITSNVTALPETAGDAALLCDPFSIESMAGAMQRLASDAALRTSLIEAGRARAKEFSWDQTTQRLWDSINRAVQHPC